MQLKNNVSINIFSLTNEAVENIGELNKVSSILWGEKYIGYYEFEIWAPITKENLELLKIGNIVWCGGNNVGIITTFSPITDDKGEKKINVKGYTLEYMLATRAFNFNASFMNTKIGNIMYSVYNTICTMNTDEKRNLPLFGNFGDIPNIGENIYKDMSNKNLYELIESLAIQGNVGFEVVFVPTDTVTPFKFRIYKGVDRTQGQLENDVVEFSVSLGNLISSEYYKSNAGYKNVAYVLGEGEGAERKRVISGDDNTVGFDRKELIIDARDVQSTQTQGQEEVQMSEEEYLELLNNRGLEKLAENEEIETYTAKISVDSSPFVFGVDYNLGDYVTIIDEELNITVNAQITAYDESVSEGKYSFQLTFGFERPTLYKKITRMIG